jgi:hypothetical protein
LPLAPQSGASGITVLDSTVRARGGSEGRLRGAGIGSFDRRAHWTGCLLPRDEFAHPDGGIRLHPAIGIEGHLEGVLFSSLCGELRSVSQVRQLHYKRT